MIKCHKIDWPFCLSHSIFKFIEKGWPDRWHNQKKVHFFWGLGANNIPEIRQCQERGEDWYIVDVGYIGCEINRYPKPSVSDWNKTYWRICKGSLHNDLTNVSTDDTRFKKLLEEKPGYGYAIENYEQKEVPKLDKVLITPSSEGVSRFMYNDSQKNQIQQLARKLEEVGIDRKNMILRNKPRPGNMWWGTSIQDALKDVSVLVTNMSMCAIDACVLGVPVICDEKNVCHSIATSDYSQINNLKTPTKEEIKTWAAKAANCQFLVSEIRDGTAYEYIG